MQPLPASTFIYDLDINKLVTSAQVIKKNAASLKNKDDVKQINDKIKQINKDIQRIRKSIEAERALTAGQKAELQTRLSTIQNNLPNREYLKQLGKRLSAKPVSEVVGREPVKRARIERAVPPATIQTTLMSRAPIDLRRYMLRFALEVDPNNFVEKFKFAVPPQSIGREDALTALRYIQEKNPEAGNEITEKMEKGHPPEVILHEFFTERLDTLVRNNKFDLIKQILEQERPIFVLDNVQRLLDVATYRTELDSAKENWKYYHIPERLTDHRSRIPLTGPLTYAVFNQNEYPEVRQYCIDKFIILGDELSRIQNYRFFEKMLDLNRPNAEVLLDVRDYLDGLIQSAHMKGDIKNLGVDDRLRCQLAFARIRYSLTAIEENLIKINDKKTGDFERKRLIEDLQSENMKLQEYLSKNWIRLGALCKSDRELDKQYALLEAQLFELGHRISPKV